MTSDRWYDELGSNIRGRMLDAGMTQAALSRATGINRVTINRSLWGTQNFSPASLLLISEALNVTADELFPKWLPD